MDAYQLTHYKQPVFRAIAEEKMFEGKLTKGSTVHWSYKSDFYVENMGADGSYNTQAQTDTDETLVINQVKDTSFYEFEKDLEQAHYNVKMEYAKKAMNKIFLQIDADVLLAAYQGASSVIDAGVIAGGASNGTPLTIGVATIPVLFAAANLNLQLANVIYDPNLTFTKDVKLEKVTGMPVALISPQIYQNLIIFLGGKTTVLGDKVSVSGHAGAYMSFNIFVTNQLTSTFTVTLAATPTTGDYITINGLTFKFVTSATNAGEMTISGSSQAILTSALTNPFTAVSGYVPQTDSTTNRLKLANLSIGAFAANVATITQSGVGSPVVTSLMTSASNIVAGTAGTAALANATTVVQHNIFGVSRSVAIVIQKYPTLYVNPVSGKVGKDYVTWTYYGTKVFTYQKPQLIDVQVNAATFAQPTIVSN